MSSFLPARKKIVKKYWVVLWVGGERNEYADGVMLEEKAERVGRIIQGDIPCTTRPFHVIAEEVGISEREVIETVRELIRQGTIRRFGAVLRHGRAGITENAMVIWAVPPSRCEEAGAILSRFTEVSHCYERTPPFADRYTIFTMVHASSDGVQPLVERMKAAIGVTDFLVLESVEEFKKESMEYFR